VARGEVGVGSDVRLQSVHVRSGVAHDGEEAGLNVRRPARDCPHPGFQFAIDLATVERVGKGDPGRDDEGTQQPAPAGRVDRIGYDSDPVDREPSSRGIHEGEDVCPRLRVRELE